MGQFDACTLTGNITVNTIIVNSPSTNIYDVLIYLLITACPCVLACLYVYYKVNVSSQNCPKLTTNKQEERQGYHTVPPAFNAEEILNSACRPRKETVAYTTDRPDKQVSINVKKLTADYRSTKKQTEKDRGIHAASPDLSTEEVENSACRSGEETIPHTTVGSDKEDNINETTFYAECQADAENATKDEDDHLSDETDKNINVKDATAHAVCQVDAENAAIDEYDDSSSDEAMAVRNRQSEVAVILKHCKKSGLACSVIELKSEKRAIIRTIPTCTAQGSDNIVLNHASAASVDGQHSIKFKDELKPYFNVIAENMAVHWPQLATNLGLQFTQIQAIKQENNNDCWMCCQQILEIWRSTNGREATKEDLIQAVKETGKQDIAEKLGDMDVD